MAYSFLVFDFGRDEDVAQEARQRIDRWRQGFRLDKKLQLKFERKEDESASPEAAAGKSAKTAKGSSKGKAQSKKKSKPTEESVEEPESDASPAEIHMIVRLDFSDHEKLSHQRWLERIPGEEPFKTAKPRIVRSGDAEFDATSEKFDSLD